MSSNADGVAADQISGRSATTSRGSDLPGRKITVAIGVVSFVALVITSYLGWVALHSSKVAGCGGGSIFDCNDVISSRWSRWLGIPVSFLALGMYATLFVAVVLGSRSQISDRTRRIAWSLIIFIGLSAGLAAFWFTSLQILVLKHLCTYCLAAHSCGLFISGCLLWKRPLGEKAFKCLTFASIFGVGLLIGGQLLFKPVTYKMIEYEVPVGEPVEVETFEFSIPNDISETDNQTSSVRLRERLRVDEYTAWRQGLPTLIQPRQLLLTPVSLVTVQDQGTAAQPSSSQKPAGNPVQEGGAKLTETKPKAERRFVTMSGGTLKLDVAQWPFVGSQDAKYVFVEMFDYTCDHCRRTHAAVAGAKAELKGDVAVLLLPIPLNTKCNSTITVTGPGMVEACEISKLAIAVWRLDASQFEAFHNYLMTTSDVVTYAEAMAKAIELVDKEKLNAVLSSNVPSQYIAQHVELYKRVGAGTVPKLLFPGTSIVGEFTSIDGLVDVIKKQLK